MKIEKTNIEGLYVLHLNKLADIRGNFVKTFQYDYFSKNHLDTQFKECYFSASRKNVIRGMHFQTPPHEHTKLIWINQGSILDVVLDVRKSSPTFGHFFSMVLTPDEPKLIYITKGLAHGYLTYKNNSIVSYCQTSVFHPGHYQGIRWDSFGMPWGITDPILSEKDSLLPAFEKIRSGL